MILPIGPGTRVRTVKKFRSQDMTYEANRRGTIVTTHEWPHRWCVAFDFMPYVTVDGRHYLPEYSFIAGYLVVLSPLELLAEAAE